MRKALLTPYFFCKVLTLLISASSVWFVALALSFTLLSFKTQSTPYLSKVVFFILSFISLLPKTFIAPYFRRFVFPLLSSISAFLSQNTCLRLLITLSIFHEYSEPCRSKHVFFIFSLTASELTGDGPPYFFLFFFFFLVFIL